MDCAALTILCRFPPDKEPWPPYTICKFLSSHNQKRVIGSDAFFWPFAGDFFLPAFSCPHELERIGALGDGGKWVCGLSQLQEKEDCIVYSVGTSLPEPLLVIVVVREHVDRPLQDLLRMHLSKPSFWLALVIASFMSLITPHGTFRVRSPPLHPWHQRSASFIPRGTR